MKFIVSVFALLLLAVGCSSESVPEQDEFDFNEPTPASLIQGVTNFSAVNGIVTTKPTSTHFCHATRFVASGGHQGAPVLTWGIPIYGAVFTTTDGAASARTNGGHGAGGNARVDVQCDDWFNFHGNATAQMVTGVSLTWPQGSVNPPTNLVQGTAQAYYQDSACWLSILNSLSITGEQAGLIVSDNPWTYTLKAQGWAELQARADCAWLGRHITSKHWLTSTIASSAMSTLTPAQGVCLIMSVKGNIDDGQVRIVTHSTGVMMLNITGQVSEATAVCFAK
jgi:hypothetical protein